MRASVVFSFGLLVLLGSSVCCRAECGDTEQDRLVYARERMHPGIAEAQLRLVYQWLLNGTRSCPFSGDLWYYRGLVAQKLGDASDAKYSFGKATEKQSAFQAASLDPLAIGNQSTGSAAGKTGEKYALLVGVQDMEYSDEMLQFASRDARELGTFLRQSAGFKEEHVKVLTGKDATTQGIREAFGEIRMRAKPDDFVLVYFSSHGRPRDLDPTGLSYVLTYDTDTRTPAKVFSTALQMVELAELGRWIKARDYVLLLDTCYSGAARAGGIVPAGSNGLDPLQGLAGSGNRAVISASRADEASYEDEGSRHGYFTRFLLEAMGRNASPQSVKTVYQYVQTHVSDEVAQSDGRQQHPVMEAFGQGEQIVLSGSSAAALSSLDHLPPMFSPALARAPGIAIDFLGR